jgi:hypothetical protein
MENEVLMCVKYSFKADARRQFWSAGDKNAHLERFNLSEKM